MAVSAYLEAARMLRLDTAREFALLTLNRLLNEAWVDGSALRHVIAYPEGNAPETAAPGTLDDYAFAVQAALDAWFATGRLNFYRAAVRLADQMIARFHDSVGGGFFDAAREETALGALLARRKPLQDAPTSAGNSVAAAALLRLESLGGRSQYREIAEETLACNAGAAAQLGLSAGSYGLALERLLLDPIQVVIVGAGAEAERLEALAQARFAVNKTVVRVVPSLLAPGQLPEALEETLLGAPNPKGAAAWALVCKGRVCLPPITDGEALLEAIEAQA
jgi:uncharacterized protein YyaL (SSP411 family)